MVRAIARYRTPVTFSVLGHRDMWEQSKRSGDFFLTPIHKSECQKDRKKCSGHALPATSYDINRKIIFIKNS